MKVSKEKSQPENATTSLVVLWTWKRSQPFSEQKTNILVLGKVPLRWESCLKGYIVKQVKWQFPFFSTNDQIVTIYSFLFEQLSYVLQGIVSF